MSYDFTTIPTIDLSRAKNPVTKDKVLQDLRHAILNVGFLYISNHGVPADVTRKLVDALPRLFALPNEEKAKISLINSPHFLGYSGFGTERTAGNIDGRQQFEFATELTDDWTGGQPLAERLKGPNQWPSTYPELRPIVESYISALTKLGEDFLHLVAESLHLPPNSLHSFTSDQHRLKLVHYPVSEGSSQGVGPHKDSSGWWTFLLQASPPHVNGLQALNKSGEWIDVPNIPNAFVVNIGQGFEVVTNGVCKATTHRVLSGSEERYSIPFFQGMRRDLTKAAAVNTFEKHFNNEAFRKTGESREGRHIDSAFLEGKYDTWGETQLRTKVRSHQDVGKRFYSEVFDRYIDDA